jgi:hypothetical protein
LFLELLQQPHGVLNLVSDGRAARRVLRTIKRPPQDGGDLIEVAFQRCWRCWLLLRRFQKQFRRGENPFARLFGPGIAPRVVDQCSLPRGPGLVAEDLRHAHALLAIDARHWSQIPHGDLRRDATVADLLLHRFRQCVHQCQAARHPTGAAVKAPRQIGNRVAEPLFHLRKQPTLFERCFRFAVDAQGTYQQQRFAFVHVPNDRVDRVAFE